MSHDLVPPPPPTHLWHKLAKHVEKDENGGNDTEGDSRTVVEEDVSVAGGGEGEDDWMWGVYMWRE